VDLQTAFPSRSTAEWPPSVGAGFPVLVTALSLAEKVPRRSFVDEFRCWRWSVCADA
jgi:hypothetical protein